MHTLPIAPHCTEPGVQSTLTRASVWIAAAVLVTIAWMAVLWYIFAFYWSTTAATSAVIGTSTCAAFYAALPHAPAGAAIGAAGLLLIPLLLLGSEPSMFYVAGVLVLGYIAWLKAEWSAEFAVEMFARRAE